MQANDKAIRPNLATDTIEVDDTPFVHPFVHPFGFSMKPCNCLGCTVDRDRLSFSYRPQEQLEMFQPEEMAPQKSRCSGIVVHGITVHPTIRSMVGFVISQVVSAVIFVALFKWAKA